jgi:hypothetical protein
MSWGPPSGGLPTSEGVADDAPHSALLTQAERLREIAQFAERRRPEGTTTPWWKY